MEVEITSIEPKADIRGGKEVPPAMPLPNPTPQPTPSKNSK